MVKVLTVFLLVLTLLLVACGDATPTPAATAGAAGSSTASTFPQTQTGATGAANPNNKTLVIGLAEVTDSLDPARGFTTSTIFRATYDTLVTFPDKDAGQILPRLASKWTVSPDGKIYTFTLRDDVVFSNGDKLTADDVVFSIHRLQNIKGNPAFLADPIKSAMAADARTVVLTLSDPNPAFLAMLANVSLSITDAKVVKQNGGTDANDAAKTDTAENFLNAHSVGTGPYMLDSWERQVKTVLVRNPKYVGKAPFFDKLILTNIPTAAARKEALEAGTIDLALDLSADQIASFENNPKFTIYRGPSEIIHFLAMNRDPAIGGPVANPTVALAIRYALDYDGYHTLWKGSITPGSNLMVGLPGAYGQDKAFKRDLNKAKQLLKDAGYSNGFDITLDYPTTTYGGVDFNINAQKIKADLEEAGIRVKLNPGEFNTSLEAYRQGKQAFSYWLWGPNILDPSDLLSFLPNGTAGKRVNWTDTNSDSEIRTLRDKATVELNNDERIKQYGQIQDYLQQKGPWVPFNEPSNQTAFKSSIKGFVWHPAWQLDISLLSRE